MAWRLINIKPSSKVKRLWDIYIFRLQMYSPSEKYRVFGLLQILYQLNFLRSVLFLVWLFLYLWNINFTHVRSCSCRHSLIWSYLCPLHWRHNGHDGISNHQPHGCLLNRLFRRRSKKTSKLRVTGLCEGNSPGPMNSPHKGPVRWRHHASRVGLVFCSHHTEPNLSLPQVNLVFKVLNSKSSSVSYKQIHICGQIYLRI